MGTVILLGKINPAFHPTLRHKTREFVMFEWGFKAIDKLKTTDLFFDNNAFYHSDVNRLLFYLLLGENLIALIFRR